MTQDREMSVTQHLSELRGRLLKSLAAVVIGMAIALFFVRELRLALLHPLVQALPGGASQLITVNLMDPMIVDLKLAAVAGVFLSAPAIFYQLWGFIAPGLYPAERKLVVPFISVASLFFTGGAAFGYFVVFPVLFQVAINYMGADIVAMPDLQENVAFIAKMLLAFGCCFELPILMFLLSWLGVITPAALAKYRKYAVVGAFVLAAVVTPGPDMVSQLLLAVPLVGLYLLGELASRLAARRNRVPPAATANSQPLAG